MKSHDVQVDYGVMVHENGDIRWAGDDVVITVEQLGRILEGVGVPYRVLGGGHIIQLSGKFNVDKDLARHIRFGCVLNPDMNGFCRF